MEAPQPRSESERQYIKTQLAEGTVLYQRGNATFENIGVMFERFTDRARRVLVFAQEEARLLNQSFIGIEHLLLALIHEGEGVPFRALAPPQFG